LITALYAQDELGITSRLTLDAGVRYDHYSTFGGTTNPRLALIYRPASKTTLKLLYGDAFSARDVYQISPDFGSFYDERKVGTYQLPDLLTTSGGVRITDEQAWAWGVSRAQTDKGPPPGLPLAAMVHCPTTGRSSSTSSTLNSARR
jgi:outer membrane receptor protein involved in Fe transport